MANEICETCGDRIYDLGGDIAERLRDLSHEAFALAEAAEKERAEKMAQKTGKPEDAKGSVGVLYIAAFGQLEVLINQYAHELERGCVCHINRVTTARFEKTQADGPDDADDDHGLDALVDPEFDEENAA